MSTAEAKETRNKSGRVACPVQPFVVEITGNNSDVVIQSIPACVVRGAVKANKRVFSPKSEGKTTIAPSGNFPGIPEVPGMWLKVNPGRCVCTIEDPLAEDKPLLQELEAALKAVGRMDKGKKLEPLPTRKEELEPSRMKTLVREVVQMIECGMAKMKRGELPAMENIEKLKGHFLLNPGARVANYQPRYEKDYEAYVAKLQSMES